MAQTRAAVEIVSADKLRAAGTVEAEVLKYATFLGIDVDKDEDLLWIARAGLRELAPEPWLTCQKEGSRNIFFYNPETGKSTWQHPQDQVFKDLVTSCLAHRVTVPVTLSVRAAPASECVSGAVEIVAHKLSGSETSTRVAFPGSTSFECVRRDLDGELCQKLPANAVVRFFLADGTQLGRSYGARTVAEIFCLPQSDAQAISEVEPQLPITDDPLQGAPGIGSEPTRSDIELVHGACFGL